MLADGTIGIMSNLSHVTVRIAPRNISILLAGASVLMAQEARATHVAAAEVLYQCTGAVPNEFLITLNLYRDCEGSPLSAVQTVQINNPCGGPQFVDVNEVLVQEVSQLCPEELINSTCNGGTLPGIELHQYTAVVTLPPCDFITFSWTLCCRNGAIDNIIADVANTDMYVETTMYSQSFPCDDSPVFNASPIPYLCQGYPASYGFGTTEANGDILVFEFIEALEAPGLPCVYISGYSHTEPITGIAIDPTTGQLTFTPLVQGNFVVTVLVSQYTADSVLIGTVMRDMQFVVIPCNNVPPDPTTGVVENVVGGQAVTDRRIDACGLGSICFDLTIVDPDVGQTVTLETNVQAVMPGSTITYAGTNPVTASICWNVPSDWDDDQVSFQILATDDACPITAFSSYVYTVDVCPPPSVEIPNVFSPNDDGENDAFYFMEFRGFASYKMMIFNRWGQMLHETSTFREDDLIWQPAKDIPEGTYYYIFTGIQAIDDREVDKHGFFTLLR
jgi:gliding motility-associated-like protein